MRDKSRWHHPGRFSHEQRLLIFVYGVALLRGVLRHVPLCHRLRRQPRRAEVDGFGARGAASARRCSSNLGLLGLFAVQHSVMARPAFKRWWTRIVPGGGRAQHLRAVLQPRADPAVLRTGSRWAASSGTSRRRSARPCCTAALPSAGSLVLVSTFLINHFDLFGLRQVWLQLARASPTAAAFGTPLLYRYVRHPLYVGWLFAFWATPTMTRRAPGLRCRDHGLHPDRDPARRARPDRRASRVRRVPPARADAGAVHEAPAASCADAKRQMR